MSFKNIKFWFLFAVLSLGSATAYAEGKPSTEQLLVKPPPDYILAFKNMTNPNAVIFEYVPPGQDTDNWTDMVTIQLLRIPTNVTPEMFLYKIAKTGETFCQDYAINQIAPDQHNAYANMGLLQGCGTNKTTEKGELTLYHAIRGKDYMYMVQKAWKTEPFSDKSPISQDEIKAWISYLHSAKVVDSEKGPSLAK